MNLRPLILGAVLNTSSGKKKVPTFQEFKSSICKETGLAGWQITYWPSCDELVETLSAHLVPELLRFDGQNFGSVTAIHPGLPELRYHPKSTKCVLRLHGGRLARVHLLQGALEASDLILAALVARLEESGGK